MIVASVLRTDPRKRRPTVWDYKADTYAHNRGWWISRGEIILCSLFLMSILMARTVPNEPLHGYFVTQATVVPLLLALELAERRDRYKRNKRKASGNGDSDARSDT